MSSTRQQSNIRYPCWALVGIVEEIIKTFQRGVMGYTADTSEELFQSV